MGFSVSATMAIFFATFLILFSILYSSVDRAFDTVTESFDDKYDRLSIQTQTDIEILDMTYLRETDVLEVTLQNTGSVSLDTRKMNLLVGGVLVTTAEMTAGGVDTDFWLPQEAMRITLSGPDLCYADALDPRTFTLNDARLTSPGNISVGDNAYIIDGTDIDVFDLDGVFNFTIDDAANLIAPTDLKVWEDSLYVLDEHAHVDLYSADGVWSGRIVDDAGNASNPTAMAVDASYIYLIDADDHVDRFNRTTGGFVDVLVANGGGMTSPLDIFVGSYVFVIDRASGQSHVDRYALDGTGGVEVIGSGNLSSPTDIAASASGLDERSIYVLDGGSAVAVFNESGAYQGEVCSCLSDSASGVDVTGRIFVSDSVNGLVIENLGTSIKVVTEYGISEVSIL